MAVGISATSSRRVVPSLAREAIMALVAVIRQHAADEHSCPYVWRRDDRRHGGGARRRHDTAVEWWRFEDREERSCQTIWPHGASTKGLPCAALWRAGLPTPRYRNCAWQADVGRHQRWGGKQPYLEGDPRHRVLMELVTPSFWLAVAGR
jgi:hypothetical protein